ncbi:hypothetical protein D3C78_714480 [compost metagenome]
MNVDRLGHGDDRELVRDLLVAIEGVEHLLVVLTHHQGNVLFVQAEALCDGPKQVDAENRGLLLKQLPLAGVDHQSRLAEHPDDLFQPLDAQVEIHHLLTKRVGK